VSKRLGSPYVPGRSRHWVKEQEPGCASGEARGGRGWGKEKWAMNAKTHSCEICGPKTGGSRNALRNLCGTRGRRLGKECRNGCCIVQSISAT
jgi:hypothetical protein